MINDPANVEHVLRHNDIFVKGALFRTRSWDLFGKSKLCCLHLSRSIIFAKLKRYQGNGIINADGDLWRVQRKAGLRFFSSSNLRIFIDDVLPSILQDTQKMLDDVAAVRTRVDLQEVFLELTTRFMGKVAFDVSF